MASQHKNTIEINGKIYDAKSGHLINGHVIQPSRAQRSQSVDGFIKPAANKPVATPEHHTQVTLKPKTKPSRQVTASHQKRTTQKSQILMRRVVKKPTVAQKATEVHAVNHAVNSGERIVRAQAVNKSPYIHRYNSTNQTHIVKKSAPLSVKEAPGPNIEVRSTHPKAHAQTHKVVTPLKQHTPAVSASEALFNKALDNAATPKKPARHKRIRSKSARRASMASGVTAAVLLAGFIAYLNWPNLNLRLASSQAGFTAEMPSYQPAGYRFSGPINYQAGKVTLNFKSNTDDRGYSIQQEVSNWNSQSLQENFLASQNKTFEIQQEAGRTIYLYDNGKATWVNGGVWYQLDGSSLSPDQLIKVASSL